MYGFGNEIIETIANAIVMVPPIIILNHSKSEHENFRYLNVFRIQMFGIQALTVQTGKLKSESERVVKKLLSCFVLLLDVTKQFTLEFKT